MAENKVLAMTARPRHLVNRTKEMSRIREAIVATDKQCRVVLITGSGGLGKTRLLEEVLRRAGDVTMRKLYGPPLPQDDWLSLGRKAAFANIIDLTDIRFHIREFLLQHLGNPTNWSNPVDFPKFTLANNRYQRVADVGAAYSLLGPAIEQAKKAFEEDFSNASKRHRLVILFDTAEQLPLSSSPWLREHGLEDLQDTASSAQEWILGHIKTNALPNTTLIIAGRDEEGGSFFEDVKGAAQAPKSKCKLTEVPLESFDIETTREFILQIHKDWESTGPGDPQTLVILSVLEGVLSDRDRLRVLQHYTGGNPVLLSMYVDLLYEGLTLPPPLQDSYAEALQRAPDKTTLKSSQKEIETAFVDLLFRSGETLRAQILQALVRTPRGLRADQLHFVIDGDPKTIDWDPDPVRLAKIEREIDEIHQLTVIRTKADGRVGLQDEIYRIYVGRVLRDPTSYEAEAAARKLLYTKLHRWAARQVNILKDKRRGFLIEDLKRINVERPANVLSSRMQPLAPWEQEQRQRVNSALEAAELEHLHYSLLLDPSTGFNRRYYNLSLRQSKTFNPAAVAMTQAEMWRVLSDERILAFTFIPVYPAAQQRGETGVQILQRAADQDIAAQTIIHRYLRKEYKEAIEAADRIDAVVRELPESNEKDKHCKDSWSHTLARANRGCWREFARIYTGLEIPKAIESLKKMVEDLEALEQADIHTTVFPDRGSGEKGFSDHPAEHRMLFLIANIYDFIGYGEVSLGHYQEAVENYTTSLQYWRQQKLPVADALEASTRNNLSRALVEMGKKRSVRMCLDALQLRIRSYQLLPIALSYNTLGLIQNDLKQPAEALDASARALAIAQFIGDARVVGLAMLQVGEALRRLATSAAFIRGAGEAQSLFGEAEKALLQAHDIFSTGEASQETIRQVEAALELGTLYREWVAAAKHDDMPTPEAIIQSRRNNALQYLTQAADLAGDNVHLALDAWVNVAWTHYYAGRYSEAFHALDKADQLVDDGEKKSPGLPIRLHKCSGVAPIVLPNPTQLPVFWYKHLSKMHTLRGEIAFTHFRNKGKTDHSPQHPTDLNTYLESAANDYTLALSYAQLFAPGSAPLTAAYDSLYDFLKRLNLRELSAFYEYERVAHETFAIEEVRQRFKNLGDMGDFLKDCFGDPERLPRLLPRLAAATQEGAQSDQD